LNQAEAVYVFNTAKRIFSKAPGTAGYIFKKLRGTLIKHAAGRV
jgi:hypothetical protein